MMAALAIIPETFEDEIRARTPALLALRRDLHEHPELAFEEHRTAALVADRLERAGLEVKRGVGRTGIVAELRGDRPGPVVIWRADMDALPIEEQVQHAYVSRAPGTMHACGHDGHTAIAVVLAELLAQHRQALTGTVVLVFQPAEEVLEGARAMLDTGVLDGYEPRGVFGLHLSSRFPAGRVEVPDGLAMAAADLFELIVRGRGGHGAIVQAGGDPIIAATHLVVGLSHLVATSTRPGEAAVLSIGQIRAGTTFNVIPDEAVLRGSIRTVAASTREALIERLRIYAERVASAHGATAELRPKSSCPTVVNEADASAMVCRCATGVLGSDQVSAGSLVMASDDISLFLERWPGCYFRVGAGRSSGDSPPHHSPLFDIDERSLAVGLRVACAVVTSALSSPRA